MEEKLKQKIKGNKLLFSLSKIALAPRNWCHWYKVHCKYRWMTKQMQMVDPAETKRPKYWKKCGVQSSGNFKVGYGVYFDAGNASNITIEDGVWIASRCLFLCHRRIIDNYCVGDDYNKLPYKIEPIVLKKGCCIGMESVVMPGVTVGEGAIVGVGSLVTKDIPPYTIAVGRPAKVVKVLKEGTDNQQITPPVLSSVE